MIIMTVQIIITTITITTMIILIIKTIKVIKEQNFQKAYRLLNITKYILIQAQMK